MRPATLEELFPKLKGSHYEITSQATPSYNCIAWALCDESRWWETRGNNGYYWPPEAGTSETVEGWMLAFARHGYSECEGGELETGFDKIALYVKGVGEPTHVARQLESGEWTSKLGALQDITHPSLEAIEIPDYGTARRFMKRPRQAKG